jgi:hypothetical protein
MAVPLEIAGLRRDKVTKNLRNIRSYRHSRHVKLITKLDKLDASKPASARTRNSKKRKPKAIPRELGRLHRRRKSTPTPSTPYTHSASSMHTMKCPGPPHNTTTFLMNYHMNSHRNSPFSSDFHRCYMESPGSVSHELQATAWESRGIDFYEV